MHKGPAYLWGLFIVEKRKENIMITRTIEYTDYNGMQRKEKFYFDLSEFEATEIAMELPDGIVEELSEDDTDNKQQTAIHLIEKLGNKGVMDFIKKIVLKSYGIKAPDGKRFIKSEELSTEFSQTPAFSNFMMRLMRDDNEASRFINGVIPADLAAKIGSANKPAAIPTNE